MNTYDVLMRPLLTEKTVAGHTSGVYAFEIHPDANKHQVKQAVEQIFDVSVVSVNVINSPAKRRRAGRRWVMRQQPRRKAVVRLAPGQRIGALEVGQ